MAVLQKEVMKFFEIVGLRKRNAVRGHCRFQRFFDSHAEHGSRRLQNRYEVKRRGLTLPVLRHWRGSINRLQLAFEPQLTKLRRTS